MKYTKYILTTFFIVSATYIVGCTYTYNKLDPEPPMVRRAQDSPCDDNFDRQADNAILTSMVVADIHFLPYREQLSSLGRTRVTAIANYLDLYGGEVRLYSQQGNEVLAQQRLETVRDFLEGQGLDPEKLTIVAGLSLGRGQRAEESAVFYYNNLVPDETSDIGQAADPSAAAAATAAAAGSE